MIWNNIATHIVNIFLIKESSLNDMKQHGAQHYGHLVSALSGHLIKESAKLLLLLIFNTAVHNLH